MDFRFTEEQLMFRDVVRDFLAKECTPAAVRALWDAPEQGPDALRSAIGALGLAGIVLPEEHGGSALSELDAVLAAEECGRAALPDALFESAAVAGPLLAELGGPVAAAWLPRVAEGSASIALVHPINPFTVDGVGADLFLLPQSDALFAVPADAVTLEPVPAIDPSARYARVSCASGAGEKIAEGDTFNKAWDLALDRAALYAAADMVGAGERMLELAVAYAKERQQFGRPIGSFQAVKHLLADVQVKLTFARPVVYHAAYCLAQGSADAALRVSHAKVAAAEAAGLAVRRTLQAHGAIGYTWEYDLQIWMKRVWLRTAAWGNSAWHRNRIAERILSAGAEIGPGRTWQTRNGKDNG